MSKDLDRRQFLKASAALGVSGASVASLLAWRAAPAAAATISVRRTGAPRPLTPAFFGLNGNNIQSGTRWDNTDLGTALASLRPGVLRYPGGTIANYWDWRSGGFQPNGPWPGDTGAPPIDNSLVPFAVGLQSSRAQALFVLNVLTIDGRLATSGDNPRLIGEQIALLQAAATAGIGVQRIELGNEFYLGGPSAGVHGSDYLTRFPTATAYAQEASGWVSALRTAFPTAQIAAVGADATGNNMARREGWNADVLASLHGADALTLHPYIPVNDPAATPQSLLSLPYQRVQSLIATEFQQLAAAGFGAWITEFNMVDQTPAMTFGGTWTHGLFIAAYALLLAQNPIVGLVDLHNVLGDAATGVLFDSTDGFNAPAPVTQVLGRSAMGATFATLLQATGVSTTAQPLTFLAGPVLDGGAPGLVGMDFTGGGQHHAVVVNLTASDATLNVSSLFSGTVHWSRTTAASLSTQITGASSVIITTGSTKKSVKVPKYSVVRMFH
jgi:hypothetical protein